MKNDEKSWIFTISQGSWEILVSKVTTPPRCVQVYRVCCISAHPWGIATEAKALTLMDMTSLVPRPGPGFSLSQKMSVFEFPFETYKGPKAKSSGLSLRRSPRREAESNSEENEKR